ncbi:MAG: hypothetical protein O3C19_04580 [Bacteroidetes bacterium]|nr:hypothetical protein [Bacteroidota bacterium]
MIQDEFSIKEYLDVKFNSIDDRFKEVNDSLSDIQKMKNDIHDVKVKVCTFKDHIDDHDDLVIRAVESYLYLNEEVGLIKLLDRLVNNKKLREGYREINKELSDEATAKKVGILGGEVRIGLRTILTMTIFTALMVALGYKIKPF